MKNLFKTYRSLPNKTKRLLSFGTIFAFLIALPLLIFSVVNKNFDIRNRAQEATSTPQACNLTVNPPRGCPVGYACLTTSQLYGADGICIGPSPAPIYCGSDLSCPTGYRCAVIDWSGPGTPPPNLNVCQPISTPIPGPTNPPCRWCGDQCVNYNSDLYCIQTAPPPNSLCKLVNGNCTVIPSPTASPPASESANQKFMFFINLEGVESDHANGARITFRFVSNDGQVDKTFPLVLAHYDFNNNYYQAGVVSYGNFLPDEKDYTVYVKGEKHLSKKFCYQNGQSTRCTSRIGTIRVPNPLSNSIYLYDFSKLPLEPGDLPTQDGKADYSDFEKIKNLMSKSCLSLTDEEKYTADLDYNGCVNTRDAYLMRKTLETKYDEE